MSKYDELCARLEAPAVLDSFIDPQSARAAMLEAAAAIRELTAERDAALSAASQQDKLREVTLATLRGVSADLEAAEAKVAELTALVSASEAERYRSCGELMLRAEAAEARVAELEGALLNIDALDPEQHIDGCSMGVIRGLVLRMGALARTAIRKGGEG